MPLFSCKKNRENKKNKKSWWAVSKKMQRSERLLGAQENPLRSLLDANEKLATIPKHHQRVHIVEGFLCQKKERVRSLLDVGEELAPCILVQKAPTRCARYMRFLEEFNATILNLCTLGQSLVDALVEIVELVRIKTYFLALGSYVLGGGATERTYTP